MLAEMEKLDLVAMSYDRDAVLNALHRTGAAQIKTHAELENTSALPADGEELGAYLSKLESALEVLEHEARTGEGKKEIVKDGFDVSYREFMAAGEMSARMDGLVETIERCQEERTARRAEAAQADRAALAALPYEGVTTPFSAFSDTAHTRSLLGLVPASEAKPLNAALSEIAEADFSLSVSGDTAVLQATFHKSVAEQFQQALQPFHFTACPYHEDVSGAEKVNALKRQASAARVREAELTRELSELVPSVRDLKVYCDFVAFEYEKASLSEKMRATGRTFLLEAYVPKEAEEKIARELSQTSRAVYFEFVPVSEDEEPPTLYRNRPIAENFEAITNMYSPPNAREFDPTTVMAFFYSVFLGFIMGDIGYGIMMTVGGGVIWYLNRKKDSTFKRLAGVFAVGGVLSVVWGFLFNSLFGISLPIPTVLPDAQRDMWQVAGIGVPSMLVISLLIGIVQLFAGYVCRAVQMWRKGRITDGILDGVVWAVFSLGVALAIVGFIEEANVSYLAAAGGITAGVSLAVAVVTAGRREKLLGKFSKGFGTLYGVINYMSDVLSYARLYGLMLSGAVIAQIVSQYSVEFITGGNAGFAVLGVALMVVGHVFNLAISLLGAYIHDARLQYVEFYGRFYEGDGTLFTPVGSQTKYVRVLKDAGETIEN